MKGNREGLKLVFNNPNKVPESKKGATDDGAKEIEEYVDRLIGGDTSLKVSDQPEVIEFNGLLVADDIIDYDKDTRGTDLPKPEVTHLDDASLTGPQKDFVAEAVARMAHAPLLRVVPKTETTNTIQVPPKNNGPEDKKE